MALPVSPGASDRRDEIVRMLTQSPDGLSDAALAARMSGPGGTVRVQTVNQLCRRMVADGRLERVGSRPILNRLVTHPPTGRRSAAPASTPSRARRRRATVPPIVGVPADKPAVAVDPPVPVPEIAAPVAAEPVDTAPVGSEPVVDEPVAAEAVAAEPMAAEPVVDEPVVDEPVAAGPVVDEPAPAGGLMNGALPAYDALKAWSRAGNVQAVVAVWLRKRGATIRSASADGQGPACDLVASLDGDDLHVEVTGWPPDGPRTHPTTVAGDWFSAAEHAAVQRRRAHPRARIVIALPDTRRYRALSRDRSDTLEGARAEVWFVAPGGAVHAG